jgi:hypothetical protein
MHDVNYSHNEQHSGSMTFGTYFCLHHYLSVLKALRTTFSHESIGKKGILIHIYHIDKICRMLYGSIQTHGRGGLRRLTVVWQIVVDDIEDVLSVFCRTNVAYVEKLLQRLYSLR